MSVEPRPRAARMRPADRHAQLLAVAESLFLARGYASVSMEDIARAAGVTRPVVYDHFGTRDGAYVACVRAARESYQARLLARIRPDATPREQIEAGGQAFFAMLEADPDRWRLLFGSNAVLPGAANEELTRLRLETIEQIRLLLAAASPLAPPERVEACAHAVSGVGERLGHWWLTRPDIPRDTIVGHFTDIVWSGLAPYVDAGASGS